MKILFSLPTDSSYYSGISRAFDFLNIETKFFDYRSYLINEKFIAKFLANRDRATWLANQRLIILAQKFRPDILLVMKGEMILQETLESIKSLGIITANWFPDYIDSFELALKLSAFYDFFFHFDPYAVSLLKRRGRQNIHYLPFAADILPDDSLGQFKSIKKYKLVFVGNYQTPREKFLAQVSDLGLAIWGDQKWKETRFVNNYHCALPFPKLKEVLEQAEIGLNVQHSYPSDGAVLRVFEVMSSGSFLLSQYKEDLDNLFVIGEDLEVFKTPVELREKTMYFLEYEKEREKIAKNGYLKVKTRHTYVQRLKELFKLLGVKV